jgi:hypothetical protein
MGKAKQLPSHVKLASKMKQQTAYKNYVLSGGSASFSQWKKDNKN